MNDNLFRMALVINTSHDSFIKNLSNVVLYLLYGNGDKKTYDVDQIRRGIKDELYMEFTSEEVKDAIRCCEEQHYIVCINKKYSLDQKGYDKVKINNPDMEIIINKYLKEYKIDNYTHDQVFDIICGYLYNLLNSNIKELMKLLDIVNNSALKILNEDDSYTDDQKKLVNDFLDWNDAEKNKILFKLIAFSVDYCRLTTKKNINSFSNLLYGKKFYLDTNIIYRLMGINNESRKKATEEFINKCKDVGIELFYTNFTYKELSDSFDHNVDKLKLALQYVNASPCKIKKLYDYKNDNSFYELYHKWASKNNSYQKWPEFKLFLKDELRNVLRSFSKKTIMNSAVHAKKRFEDLSDELERYKYLKKGAIRVSIEYDVQNILHISKERDGRSKNAWEVNDYFISADQVLAKWAEAIFPGEAPYVVIPSVWYSLLLKLTGRTDDDYKAYVEFMKLRYTQAMEFNIEEIIYAISNLTRDTNVQDRMIDILTDENQKASDDENEWDVNELVSKAYDEVLIQIRNEEYGGGYNLGSEEGYSKGLVDASEKEYKRGKLVGELESKRKSILESNKKRAKKQSIIHWLLKIISYIIVLIIIIVSGILVWRFASKDKVDYANLIISILALLPSGIGVFKLSNLFCTDIKILEERLNNKSKDELSPIDIELSNLIKDVT